MRLRRAVLVATAMSLAIPAWAAAPPSRDRTPTEQNARGATFVSSPVFDRGGTFRGQVDLLVSGKRLEVIAYRPEKERRKRDGVSSATNLGTDGYGTASSGQGSSKPSVETLVVYDDEFIRIIEVTLVFADGSSLTYFVIYNKLNGEVSTIEP